MTDCRNDIPSLSLYGGIEPSHEDVVSSRLEGGWFGLGATAVYRVSCPIPGTDKRVFVKVEIDNPYPLWYASPPPNWLHTNEERMAVVAYARAAVLQYRQRKYLNENPI